MSNSLRFGIIALGALLATASPAAAQYARWCFSEIDRGGSGATSCIFHTYAQCMETQSGIGGICFENPYPRSNAGSARGGRPDKRQPRY
jgi:hypothetical protein